MSCFGVYYLFCPENFVVLLNCKYLDGYLLICRYGNQVTADELTFLYGESRARGFGPEVCISGNITSSRFLA